MLDVFKCLMPMFLAAIFDFSAAIIVSTGIKSKTELKLAVIIAILIELIAFLIWIPNLNDLFNIIGLAEGIKSILFVVAIVLILIASAIVVVFDLKQKT